MGEKVLNLDEILYDPENDIPPVLAMAVSLLEDFGINLYFKSDSKKIEVVATRGVGEDKKVAKAYLEKTNIVLKNDN